jgi:lipoprotein-releasing system permease protein
VLQPGRRATPDWPAPTIRRFKVAGIFEAGFYEIDDSWAFTSIAAAQKALSLEDVVNAIELKLDDLNRAPEIARRSEMAGPRNTPPPPGRSATSTARRAARRTHRDHDHIGLIELVAALNILITLVMMVMEKYRDIAMLMSMGARRQQIRASSCCRAC